MNTSMLRVSLLLVALASALAASAAPLRYTLSGSGPVTLDGSSTTGPWSLSVLADSTSATSAGAGFYSLGRVSPTVTVAGVADVITTPVSLNLSQTIDTDGGFPLPSVGFQNGTLALPWVYMGNASLASYDLRSPIGPLTGPSALIGTGSQTLNTARGTFNIASATGLSFSVTPVPEPASLVVLGLGTVAALRRRRRV